MSKLDISKFLPKVGEKWMKYLQPFFESEECYNIYQELKQVAKTEIVTPNSEQTWRFLLESDPENIKLIIILLDAYPGRYNKNLLHADGIPLSNEFSPDGKLQPSLTEFWNGLSAEYEEELPKVGDLKWLLQQGVFLGNAGLTCKLFKTGSMLQLWEPFWRYFFENYVSQRPDIPIIFCGKEAKQLKKFVTFNRTFELQHPSFNARNGTIWETKGVFKTCNKIIKELNGTEFMIEWNYNRWKQGVKPVTESLTKEEIQSLESDCPF